MRPIFEKNNKICVQYYSSSHNWGDIIAPFLVKALSGKDIVTVGERIRKDLNIPVVQCVGSILQWATPKVHIWGTGFISQNRWWNNIPKKIHAVRGPLTRDKILAKGFDCPEIYGDPALLMPRFYNPKVKKQFKIGVIPHYIDQRLAFPLSLFKDPDFTFINIKSGIENVVNKALECEFLISSSLHGVILGDAYNIPTAHVKFSGKVMGKDFKFNDYYASIHREYENMWVDTKTTKKELISFINKSKKDWKVDIDLDKLLDACPFRKD